MTAATGLVLVLGAFLALLTGVIRLAFRERRLSRDIAVDDVQAQQASDARLLVTIFGSIIGGMLLTVTTAWLVFF